MEQVDPFCLVPYSRKETLYYDPFLTYERQNCAQSKICVNNITKASVDFLFKKKMKYALLCSCSESTKQ